jgi:hypothetical protein
MKVEWRFQNGTSTLILLPETEREKTCIRMFREGQDNIRVTVSGQSTPESLTVVTDIPKLEATLMAAKVVAEGTYLKGTVINTEPDLEALDVR